MFVKLKTHLFVLINFYAILSNCKSINSNLKEPKEPTDNKDIAEWIHKQWSQWPISSWDPNQWPNSQWNSSHWPSSIFNQSQWPSGQWSKPSTVIHWPQTQWPSTYPRPPSTANPWWPPPTKPVTVIQKPTTLEPSLTTERPSTLYPPIESVIVSQQPSTQTTIQTTPTTQRPTTQRPTDRPTTSQPNPPTSITVKSCGLSHIPQVFIGNKIVSGKVAKGGEFPWQVILKIHTAKGPMQCGGAILNSRWVLTAAHCVSNERNGQPTAQRVDITAGVHNRLVVSAGSQSRTADCVVQHESWSGQYGKFKHDIALLRLPSEKPIDINFENGGHINGICLPSNPMSEYSGKGRIAGWGLTKDRGSPSDILMYTDVSILNNEKCKQYPYPVPIADSMICQGVDRTAPCQGDSGGPLIISIGDKRGVQRMTEVGIVSFGPGECANSKTPNAIYTKVSHYLKWIEKTIKANSGSKCLARELIFNTTNKIDDISSDSPLNQIN